MITGLLVLAAEIARTFLSAPAERRNLSVKISLARQAPLLCSVRSARLCNAEAHWRGCRMRGVKIKEKTDRPAMTCRVTGVKNSSFLSSDGGVETGASIARGDKIWYHITKR